MDYFDVDIVIKNLAGSASQRENEIFDEWINKSEENKAYFEQIKLVFDRSLQTEKYSRINLESAWANIVKKSSIETVNTDSQKKYFRINTVLKYAAIFLFIYALGGLTFYFTSSKKQPTTIDNKFYSISAPLGSKSRVELPDGTTVWLNSGSELKYPGRFADNERNVFLLGEAYFDVQKNAEVPFFVHTEDIDIKVLGTEFNVKSYPEEGIVETTLVEGAINISKAGNSQELLLKPQQRAVFVKKTGTTNSSGNQLDDLTNGNQIDRKEQFLIYEDIDTDLFSSWKDNRLRFKSETFESLAVKIERWYNVEIHIEDEYLRSKVFTGSFQEESLEQILEALRLTLNFKYSIDKNNVWIR